MELLIPDGNNNNIYKFVIFVIIKGELAAGGSAELGGTRLVTSIITLDKI